MCTPNWTKYWVEWPDYSRFGIACARIDIKWCLTNEISKFLTSQSITVIHAAYLVFHGLQWKRLRFLEPERFTISNTFQFGISLSRVDSILLIWLLKLSKVVARSGCGLVVSFVTKRLSNCLFRSRWSQYIFMSLVVSNSKRQKSLSWIIKASISVPLGYFPPKHFWRFRQVLFAYDPHTLRLMSSNCTPRTATTFSPLEAWIALILTWVKTL